jgi:tetratricopeptide (TPR) repeat protein
LQEYAIAHPTILSAAHYHLGSLYLEQGAYQKVEIHLQQALALRERSLPSDHPHIANVLFKLARFSVASKRDEEAEVYYQRALEIRRRKLGSDNPETAETLHDLALFRQKQGNVSEALSLAERALQIRSQALGDAHPETLATRTLSAQLVQEQTNVQGKAASERRPEAIPNPCENERHEIGGSSPLHKTVTPAPSEDNPLQEFLDACCELDPRAWCRSADLWQAYVCWVEEHQERFPLSRGAFIAQLKAHGCRSDRTKSARIWRGIALVNKNDDGG